MRHVQPKKVVVNTVDYDPKKYWLITNVERGCLYKYKFYFKTIYKIKGRFQTVFLQADSQAEAWEKIGFPQWKEDVEDLK